MTTGKPVAKNIMIKTKDQMAWLNCTISARTHTLSDDGYLSQETMIAHSYWHTADDDIYKHQLMISQC